MRYDDSRKIMTTIHHITQDSELYPPLLREIPDPPVELFIRGNVKALQSQHMLAVVGSRKASFYGKQCVNELLPPIIQAGVTIVSGLAYGIDSLAHHATLEHSGTTIAVLGSGIDDASLYPRSHISLAHNIIKTGGAIVSEYPEGTPAMQFHFPERNRIIAGLCQATLLIQAAQRSGSLITGRLALEDNRDVCAVPGAITDPLSEGTNQLLRQGATPITSANDLLDVLGISKVLPQESTMPALTDQQKPVWVALSEAPQQLDYIIEKTKLPSAEVAAIITQLELIDAIQHIGGQRYVRKDISVSKKQLLV